VLVYLFCHQCFELLVGFLCLSELGLCYIQQVGGLDLLLDKGLVLLQVVVVFFFLSLCLLFQQFVFLF
jgi:hypothetical protein